MICYACAARHASFPGRIRLKDATRSPRDASRVTTPPEAWHSHWHVGCSCSGHQQGESHHVPVDRFQRVRTVAGGQVPGQINQPQAIGAGIQSAQTGSAVGSAAGAGLGAAIAPPPSLVPPPLSAPRPAASQALLSGMSSATATTSRSRSGGWFR
jgi:hypothetical protein